MLPYIVFGATYAFAAAAQPGQFQAYLFSRAIANGWRRTLPAVFAPVLSDLPIVTLVLLVLTRVPPAFVHGLRVVGGLFLLYLALGAWRAFRAYGEGLQASPASPQRTLLEAALVNLFNPNPYLGWTLILGPLLIQAWRQSPAAAVALVVAFYLTLILASVGLVVLFALARSLGPRVARWLVAASAVALAAFGAYQLWAGVAGLR